MFSVTLVTGLVRVSDRGIWEAFEKWDSRVGQRNLSFPNFWYGSLHLHSIGGEDEGTERRGSTFWCGWDGKMNIEDNCGSQWVLLNTEVTSLIAID